MIRKKNFATMSEGFLREQKTLHILLFLFFLQSRSRRGSRNSITEEKKRGGKFKKKKVKERRKKEKGAHTFVAMHKGTIYGQLSLLQVEQRGKLVTRISFEIAESFARKRRAPDAAGGKRKSLSSLGRPAIFLRII